MWAVEFLPVALQELEKLPADMRASFERIVRLIQAFGVERVHEPYIRHVEGRLWEMRLKGRDGIARALYVTTVGRRIIVLRTFVKKTRKTPRSEIELALQRAKELR